MKKMLDRAVVEEFLGWEFEDLELKVPKSIPKDALVEAFCQYTEHDYYKWLNDNFKSFFVSDGTDWEWIKEKIKAIQAESKRA